jgi:hypothetical protein
MTNKTRNMRRHHRARKIRKVSNYTIIYYWNNEDSIPSVRYERAKLFADNPTICSCMMCRNPRRNDWAKTDEKLTMPERKANDSYNDQIEELSISTQ